jgi:outer membrane protein OmpA-like peptidoglycan-associated protein
MSRYSNSKQTGENKMKKVLFFAVFIFLALAMTTHAEETKKIYNLQKAYVYMEESLLISETDLNCSYFIKDDMPEDIEIVAKYLPTQERNEFSDGDNLIINKGSLDGLKEGEQLLIMNEGRSIRGLGHYFLKKSLAEITTLYKHQSVIQLKSGCNNVNIGDFAIPFKPEKTLFAKKINYLLTRIPDKPVSGDVVYNELVMSTAADIAGDTQYVTVDLGKGLVKKGIFLLFYRRLDSDLPPLIIGLGIVIHSENTNSTVKILDSNSPVTIKDHVFVLTEAKETIPATAEPGKTENIPVVEAQQVEGQENTQAGVQPQAGEGQAAVQKGNTLNIDVLFAFDSKEPKDDHSNDFAAIKDFIAAKSEYLVTLRGYTCSIGGDEYNLRLSKERVEGIKNILITKYGVDAAHVETFFYGEKEPNFDNSSEVERQKNRLVKIEVSGK